MQYLCHLANIQQAYFSDSFTSREICLFSLSCRYLVGTSELPSSEWHVNVPVPHQVSAHESRASPDASVSQ